MEGYYSSESSKCVIGSTRWIDLDQDSGRRRTFKTAVMNLRAPENFLSSCGPVSFSIMTLFHVII